MTRHLDPRLRVSLYLAVASVGAALVVWGVVTQDLVDAILPTVAGVLAVSGGATAVRNITPAPRDEGPSMMEWAIIGRDNIPTILAEVRALRTDLTPQPLPETVYALGADPLPVYDQPTTGTTYTGRHRWEG